MFGYAVKTTKFTIYIYSTAGPTYYSYSNYSGSVLTGTGNISSDPHFKDPDNHIYTLEWPSNSINTANPNPDESINNYELDPNDQDSVASSDHFPVLAVFRF